VIVVSDIEGNLIVLESERRQVASNLRCREVESRNHLHSVKIADVDTGEIIGIEEWSRSIDGKLIVRVKRKVTHARQCRCHAYPVVVCESLLDRELNAPIYNEPQPDHSQVGTLNDSTYNTWHGKRA